MSNDTTNYIAQSPSHTVSITDLDSRELREEITGATGLEAAMVYDPALRVDQIDEFIPAAVRKANEITTSGPWLALLVVAGLFVVNALTSTVGDALLGIGTWVAVLLTVRTLSTRRINKLQVNLIDSRPVAEISQVVLGYATSPNDPLFAFYATLVNYSQAGHDAALSAPTAQQANDLMVIHNRAAAATVDMIHWSIDARNGNAGTAPRIPGIAELTAGTDPSTTEHIATSASILLGEMRSTYLTGQLR